MEHLDDWERHLCAPFTGRKVIGSFELLAGMTSWVANLQRWGAERPLLIADGRGTGPVPDSSAAEIVVVEPPGYTSVTDQVRARMQPQQRLTPEVVAAVEAYDPERTAAWWASPVALNEPLLGRPVLGGRPPAQARLEDKLLVDELLEAVEAPRAPAVQAPATYDDGMRATERVLEAAGGDSVVWSGDARGGTNGGGDYVRWIRSPAHARDAAAFFAEHCDRIRVSAFLEGVPCSIHGICLPDGVVVLRPVELATLRSLETGRFLSAGLGTTWDPPSSDADDMRQLARRLGRHLQDRAGYRGGFGLDGVLTADGFRVTELNPRLSGGLTRLHRAAPQAQLELVHVNALLGRDVGRAAARIEEEALTLLEDRRIVDVLTLSPRRVLDEHVEVPVAAGEAGLEATADEANLVGSVAGGPSSLGTFFRLTLLDGVARAGERMASYGVLLVDLLDRTWGAGLGPVQMAPEVHR